MYISEGQTRSKILLPSSESEEQETNRYSLVLREQVEWMEGDYSKEDVAVRKQSKTGLSLMIMMMMIRVKKQTP
jgi:hypothetical protein